MESSRSADLRSGFRCNLPEVHITLHQSPGPGGFQLLSPPQLRKCLEVPRNLAAVAAHNRVDIKQCAVGVE